jgi:hypothetical protein
MRKANRQSRTHRKIVSFEKSLTTWRMGDDDAFFFVMADQSSSPSMLCVCVCVCVRERERERESNGTVFSRREKN